ETASFCNHCGKNLAEESNDTDATNQTQEESQENVTEGADSGQVSEETEAKETADQAQVDEETQSSETTEPVSEEQPDDTEKSEAAATVVETREEKPEKPKKKGKMKYLVISAAVVVLLLVGGYAYGSYATSVNHLLDDFEEAVKEKDTKQLATLLTTEEKDLKITADSLEGFVEFFDSKPSELKSLMKHLNSQTKKNSKKFFIFDDYKLILNPVYINVSVNYKDTDIIVNEDVIVTTDTENFDGEVGPLIPGEYDVKADYDTGLFHITDEQYVRTVD